MTATLTEPVIDGQATFDVPESPDAPYGLKEDGTPKAKPGRKPSAAKATAAPPRRKAAEPVAKGHRDFRKGLRSIVQSFAAALMLGGRKSPPLLADAGALALHGPELVEGLQEASEEWPWLADRLEWVVKAGPGMKLGNAVLALGLQCSVNHGVIPSDVGQMLGAEDPNQLARQMVATAEAAARQAAAEAAARTGG